MIVARLIRLAAGLTLAAITLLVAYGFARVTPPAMLTIRWIDVTGPFARVSAEQIRSAVAPHLDQGFLATDPEVVRRAVEKLPWVRSAKIAKDWPDTVRIRVDEHEPLARWEDGRLVSDSGRLFVVDGSLVPKGLPLLAGGDDHVAELIVFFQEVERRLTGTGLDVTRVERSSRGAWTVELGEGFPVVLGAVDPLQRLARFLTALPELERVAGRQLKGADLRYGNGFAVRWRPATGPIPPSSPPDGDPDDGALVIASHRPELDP